MQTLNLFQACGWIHKTLSLKIKPWNFSLSRVFVRRSTDWFFVLIGSKWKRPCWSFSLTTWQSISRCLVLSWKLWFSAIWRANWRLHKRLAVMLMSVLRSSSKYVSHWTSQHVFTSVLYSASDEDLETIFCFFVFHEISESQRKMQYLVVERRVEKALIWISLFFR